MTCIEREIESTKIRVTLTADHGIDLEVTPGPGAFIADKSIGCLFKIVCENKDLCAQSSAGLSNPKILEAMLKFAPITVSYIHTAVMVKFASSFFGVDTSLSLVALRVMKPRGPDTDADGL